MTMEIVPITFREACAFVAEHHRHHKPPRGHKFSVAIRDDRGEIVGVMMSGRPVSRHQDDGYTLEVNRTATDGTKNANSMLYGAAWRAARALGYRRIITYTQEGESGSSLRAAGWVRVADRKPQRGWSRDDRPREDHGVDGIARVLWEVKR